MRINRMKTIVLGIAAVVFGTLAYIMIGVALAAAG
jgi:hypothetical protein